MVFIETSDMQNTTRQGRDQTVVTTVRRSSHRTRHMYVCCALCVVLFGAFLGLRVEPICIAQRDALVALLSYTEVGVVASTHDGFPALAAGGRVFFYTPECTYVGLLLILSPFLWVFGIKWRKNAARIVGVGAVVISVNLIRCWAAVHGTARGADWFYAHDIPNYVIWLVAIPLAVIAAIRRDSLTTMPANRSVAWRRR